MTAFIGVSSGEFFPWIEPGTRCDVAGPLEFGVCGFHVVDATRLVEWIAPAVWEVEAGADRVDLGQGEMLCRELRFIQPLAGWSVAVGAVLMARCLDRVFHVAPLRDPPGQSQVMLLWFGHGMSVDGRRYPPRDIPICLWGWVGPIPPTPHPAWIVNNALRAACAVVGDVGGVPAMQRERHAQTEDLWDLLGQV